MRMTQEARRALKITLDYTNMTDKALGEAGIAQKDLLARKKTAQRAHEAFLQAKKDNTLPLGWTRLPYQDGESVRKIRRFGREIAKKFDCFVVLGIGGSALGPLTAFRALCHLHHNELPKAKRKGPRFYVEDNIDPVRMKALLDVLDLKKTCFNVISKSGGTAETLSQLLVVIDLLKREGLNPKEHLVFTTDPENSALLTLARSLGGVECFPIPPDVGGRFSELSAVGLLPAAVLGIDIQSLLAGAAFFDKLSKSKDLFQNPALLYAMLLFLSWERGKNIFVLMPYSDNLSFFSDWVAQLFAESLGKNKTQDGAPCNVGPTPVKALGATDQHSQLQLYTEGPFDKVVGFIMPEDFSESVKIPACPQKISGADFLAGHTLEEVLLAEQRATAYALKEAGRPNYTLRIPRLNAFTLGELIYFFELAAAYLGNLLNVNAYDQPGVEAGKRAAAALLGKHGEEPLFAKLCSEGPDPEFMI